MPALVLLLVLNVDSGALGPLLRQEAFQLKPPRAFRMARMDLYHGTQVGTVSATQAPRYLSAALVDGDGEDAASMLVSVIEATLALGPSARDELSTAAVRHLRDELGQPFQLERAEVTHGRVEVLGAVRQGSQLRRVLVAAFPGEQRHVIVVASVPSGRWDELAPGLMESLDTLRVEPMSGARPPQRLLWAFVSAVAAAFLVSVGLWRRRQASRAA